LAIHESSPSPRGISAVIAKECSRYIATQYFPDNKWGDVVGGVRNENLEKQTFSNGQFDIVVSLDVMEHVYHPEKVFSEVFRTLKPGGLYICTFPVRKNQVAGWERRFVFNQDGTRHDIKEPEIHGNPVSNEGSIVTVDYGYDLHQQIAEWAPFNVRVYRFCDKEHGIIGEYTEVVVCKKPMA
jgi:SAM-dependent methyltransferase